MKIEIRHRSTNAVLFTAKKAADMGDALRQALKAGADLTRAYLADAALLHAKLPGADLTGSNLADANLCGADLAGADLSDADLTGARLADANLTGARLAGANLSGVLLSAGQLTQLGLSIPLVAALDRKMLAAVTVQGGNLDMLEWHRSSRTDATCGATHCRAGWAVHLAGPDGYALEEKAGVGVAGSLIYMKSTGRAVPDFFADNDEALADIERCAKEGASL